MTTFLLFHYRRRCFLLLAATRPADEERHPTVECGDDDMFLRESRAEIEAARRLLDRHSVTTTTTATAAREGDAGRTNVPAPAVAMEEENSTVVVHVPPAVGAIHDPGGEASIEKRVTMSPALGALSRFGDVAETEGASSSGSNGRITRPHPSDSSAKIPASGGAGAAEDFYRAALSTHLSFIATTAADDPPSSLGSTDGRAIEEGGRKPAGGVGEACRALQGDVAGVRQVRYTYSTEDGGGNGKDLVGSVMFFWLEHFHLTRTARSLRGPGTGGVVRNVWSLGPLKSS